MFRFIEIDGYRFWWLGFDLRVRQVVTLLCTMKNLKINACHLHNLVKETIRWMGQYCFWEKDHRHGNLSARQRRAWQKYSQEKKRKCWLETTITENCQLKRFKNEIFQEWSPIVLIFKNSRLCEFETTVNAIVDELLVIFPRDGIFLKSTSETTWVFRFLLLRSLTQFPVKVHQKDK